MTFRSSKHSSHPACRTRHDQIDFRGRAHATFLCRLRAKRLWPSRAQIRLAPIDAGVLADEQATIDLYARNGLIRDGLKSNQILDSSFAAAIESGAK